MAILNLFKRVQLNRPLFQTMTRQKSSITISNLRSSPGRRKRVFAVRYRKFDLDAGKVLAEEDRARAEWKVPDTEELSEESDGKADNSNFTKCRQLSASVQSKRMLSRNALNYTRINLNQIQYLIAQNRLNPAGTITIADLIRVGAISKINDGVVLLASVSFKNY